MFRECDRNLLYSNSAKMDFNPKKLKLSVNKDAEIMRLDSICRFSDKLQQEIAIEFYNVDSVKKIKYEEIEIARREIEVILKSSQVLQYVIIDLKLPQFCIPSLMLGIISAARSFISASLSDYQELSSRMKISHIFTHKQIPDTKVLCQLNIHGEIVLLLQLKNIPEESESLENNPYAYAIKTSGSTGIPKIVKVSHQSIVLNILDLKNILSITQNDKIANLTSYTFDPSIIEVFLALSSGGILFMTSEDIKNNPGKLLRVMQKVKVSLIQTTPSVLLTKFSKSDLKETLLDEKSSLRVLLLGGEPFFTMKVMDGIRQRGNRTRIFNIYGITEVSCWASIVEYTEETKFDISKGFLGERLAETLFNVRDEQNDVIEEGEGILFIGSQKRICCIDDEEFESLKLPVYRNSGDVVLIDKRNRLFYKGRQNRIIKKFGNKVDLNKLENLISNIDFILNCCCIWNEKKYKLIACVSILSNCEINREAIKIDIMKNLRHLPSIYYPDEICIMEKFPLNRNGKISHHHLRQMIENSQNKEFTYQNPREIFQSLWKSHGICSESGFVKSGGTSIEALQIVNSLSEKYHLEFSELIGMLLRDLNFADCLLYIESEIRGKKLSFEKDNFSNKKIEKVWNMTEKIDTNKVDKGLRRLEEKIDNICLWQKCKGFQIGEDENESYENFDLERNIEFEYFKSYDLKKCVDASPTVFQYSSNKVFATVGSHSGIICTVELNSQMEYSVKLPDRIEASILISNNFHGIVGCHDGNVYCLNLKTGEILWKFQTGDAVKSTAIICQEKKYIYVGSYDRHMYCLYLKDGSRVWATKPSEGSISATARLHFETRTLLFGTLDGSCVALDQITGEINWRNSLSDPIFSSAAVLKSKSVIFASVSGKFTCFNIESGVKIWNYSIDGNIFSYPILFDNPEINFQSLIIASRNKTLYCFDCYSKPILKYSVVTESPIIATPWHSNEIILFVCIDGTMKILNSKTGATLAVYKFNADVFSSPVLYQDFIIVGCRDNRLYIMKIKN